MPPREPLWVDIIFFTAVVRSRCVQIERMRVGPGRRHSWSVARQLLVLQVVIVGVLVAAGATLAYLDAAQAADRRARDIVTAIAATLADSPNVHAALATQDPSRELQPFAERVRTDAGVDFITIMNPGGIRYTHPNPALIGHKFLGNTAEALTGRLFTETYTGTLGPSVRAVAPIFGDAHRVTALVAAGITVRVIDTEFQHRLHTLIAVAAAVLAVGLTGSYLVSARLRRQTRGIAPDELRGMFEYYQAILHSIREGLVLLDREGHVVLCNDAARELLGLSANPQGLTADALGLTPGPDCVSGVPPGAPRGRDLRGRHQGVSDQHRSGAVTRPRDGKCGDRARPHRVAGTHR